MLNQLFPRPASSAWIGVSCPTKFPKMFKSRTHFFSHTSVLCSNDTFMKFPNIINLCLYFLRCVNLRSSRSVHLLATLLADHKFLWILWNVYNWRATFTPNICTNYSCSTNRKTNARFNGMLNSPHPNIFNFVEVLLKIQQETF